MAEFMMLMMGAESEGDWETYIERLIASGRFRGGSSLGKGVATVKGCRDEQPSVTGFIRITADSLDEARQWLSGNPLHEAGGRIELLEEVPD